MQTCDGLVSYDYFRGRTWFILITKKSSLCLTNESTTGFSENSQLLDAFKVRLNTEKPNDHVFYCTEWSSSVSSIMLQVVPWTWLLSCNVLFPRTLLLFVAILEGPLHSFLLWVQQIFIKFQMCQPLSLTHGIYFSQNEKLNVITHVKAFKIVPDTHQALHKYQLLSQGTQSLTGERNKEESNLYAVTTTSNAKSCGRYKTGDSLNLRDSP